MKIVLLRLLVVSVFACGCAPTQKMSDTERAANSSATINKNVAKAPAPYYLGPRSGAGPGAAGAASGPPLLASINNFRDFLEKNGIVIETIVFEELSAALRGSGKLSILDNPRPGGATINIDIKQYGLSTPNGLSSNLVPILFVVCQMVDASGKVVWTASDRVLTLGNPVNGVPAEEMRNNPKAVEKALRGAAKHISANIVKEL